MRLPCCLCMCSPLILESQNSGALCVCMCMPLIVARQQPGKRIVLRVDSYAVSVISKESKRLFFPRASCLIHRERLGSIVTVMNAV
jgi:hypothetical protein